MPRFELKQGEYIMFEISLLIMIVGIMAACGAGVMLDSYFDNRNKKRLYKVGCYNCECKRSKTN